MGVRPDVVPLLGVRPDKEVAARCSVSRQAVFLWRKALGIAPAPRGTPLDPSFPALDIARHPSKSTGGGIPPHCCYCDAKVESSRVTPCKRLSPKGRPCPGMACLAHASIGECW